MPINFNAPTTTTAYATLVSGLVDSFKALGQMLDPTFAGTLSNIPTGAKRLQGVSDAVLEEYNGTSWVTKSVAWPTKNGTGATGTWNININGTVNGYTQSTAPTPNTLAARDASGYLQAQYFFQGSGNNENPSVSQVFVSNGSDGYLRKAGIAHLAQAVGDQNTTPTGTWSFTAVPTRGVGFAGQAGRLIAFSGGSDAAVMTFWRNATYAVNMGLDTDNVFRLGGWSDGTNVYRFAIDAAGKFSAGSFFGTNLHNATLPTGTTNQPPGASGTYTPTLTNGANVASASLTGSTWKFTRSGNVVDFSGYLSVTPSAGGNTQTVMQVSVPIPSDFTNSLSDLSAVGVPTAMGPTISCGYGLSDTVNNNMSFQFYAQSTSTHNFRVLGQYTIL